MSLELFNRVPKLQIPRARFDRSHDLKTTMDPDYLIPIIVDPIYPGDTVQLNTSFLARFSTLLHPVMDNAYLDTFFFFVPNRLLWANWNKFLGEQIDPGDSIDYTIPVVDLDTDASSAHGTLGDYLGLALIDYSANNYEVQSLPIRAYYTIWDTWFRDENLQDSQGFAAALGDGPDSDASLWSTNYLKKRGKRKDYFTGCLPWLQKGDSINFSSIDDPEVVTDAINEEYIKIQYAGGPNYANLDTGGGVGDNVVIDAITDDGSPLYVDMSPITINDLRLAVQTQRFLEKDARAGTRMHELIYSHYGVVPPHQAWRPEYLGGGSTMVNVTPASKTDTNVGDLAGIGTAFGSGHGFTKSFTEHGFLMGLVSVRIDQSYSEGIERWWFDETRYDIMFPSLQFIGEQAVLNREIYLDAATIGAGTDVGVFGYQEKYAHLKYKPNRITGLFRSNAGPSLDTWHFQEQFAGEPTLNDSFIQSNAEEGIDRASGAPSEPLIILNCHFDYMHTRPMAVFSTPGMMDHF